MLMSRVVKSGNKIESLQENPWNSATMLVFRNEVRTIINNLSVFERSTRSNQVPIVIVANAQVRRHDIDNAEIRRFLLSLPDNKTEGLSRSGHSHLRDLSSSDVASVRSPLRSPLWFVSFG